MSVSIIAIEEIYGSKKAVFSVPLPDMPEVFMCVDTTPYGNENRGVVIVDSKKFLELWQAEPGSMHRVHAQGNPETWRNDRNFKFAVAGFSHGISNPVPLAVVSCNKAEQKSVSYKYLLFGRQEHTRHFHYVSFENGITRTIWLLSHSCKAFPIECYMPGAIELHRAASIEGTRVFTLHDLKQGSVYSPPAIS